jgi:hypothetical protein
MWMMNGENETILANTSNIGVDGLCVHLNQGIMVGTKADIILNFRNSTPSFSCNGVVVRSRKEREKFYNTGIKFDPLSASKRAFLDERVSELIDLEQKGKS